MKKKHAGYGAVAVALFLALSPMTSPGADSMVVFDEEGELLAEPGSEYSETDLFSEFKNMMPGDERVQKIVFENRNPDYQEIGVTLRAVPHGPENLPQPPVLEQEGSVESMNDFLSRLQMTAEKEGIPEETGSPLNIPSPVDGILLGTLKPGEKTEFFVKLFMPPELEEEYASRAGEVDWVISVCAVQDELIQTGQNCTGILWCLVPGAFLMAMGVMIRMRGQRNG